MFIYGYYYKTIRRILIGEACQHCKANNLQYHDVMCKVHHAMYIPCYPSQKVLVRKCDVCGEILDCSYNSDAQKLIDETKYPMRYYAGVMLLLLLVLMGIALFIGSNIEDNNRKKELVNEARIGFTILEKIDDHKTSMLIMDIGEDTIYVRENTQQTKGDIYAINELEYYDTIIKPYPKHQLQKMVDDGIITDIVPTTIMVYIKGSDFYNDTIRANNKQEIRYEK